MNYCVRLVLGGFAGLLCCVLASCGAGHSEKVEIPAGQYAQGFVIAEHTDYKEVIVLDPWQRGKVMQRYYLVAASDRNVAVPDNGLKITVPIRRLAVNSCTHVGFLKALGQTASLVGVCNPQLVYTPIPTEEEGCMDLGNDMQMSVEQLLLSHPDALMLSTYAQADRQREVLHQANIPVIYNNEWTETHPLARAEWLRFVAAFYGETERADSIFSTVVEAYTHLAALTAQQSLHPTILSGGNFRGTWYVPSPKSYMGRLLIDAGANYSCITDTTVTSVPLTIETTLLRFRDAEVWVGASANTLQELAAIDDKHTLFRAYQQRQVYNFLKRTTPQGGNDFWETGVVHPEFVLADLVRVLYPDLLPDYEPYFINHLP